MRSMRLEGMKSKMLTRHIRAVTACPVLIGLCLITALGGVNAAPAGAQTVPGTLSMHATIESVGVVAPYSGDDNQNNAASIWYRPVGESTWLAGPEMVVDRSAREWRVSLVYLLPGTDYEVEVRYTDPDGVTPASVGGTVETRPDYPDIGSGGHIRYVPDEGSLQAVIDAATPGDTIRLRAGTYHTAAVLRARDSGTPGHYLTIEAAPGEHVVLDGSDPDLNDTTVDNWHLYQGSLYYPGSVYYTDLAWGDSGCDGGSLPHYVGEQRGGDGMRYLLYQGTGEWNDFLAAPPGKAYYDCAGRLYVVTYDADDPDNREIHVSRQYIGLDLVGADYVRVRELEFRYYGIYGMHLGKPGADHNIIEGNTFHGIGRYLIRVGDWDTSSSSDNLIQDNHFYERGYRDSGWTGDAQYHYANSIGVRLNYAGPGNVVRRNTFKGGTDAIDVGWQSLDTDVYENLIEEYMDDGIEVDDQPGYNIRVWGNTLRYCFSGISNQGWFKGDYENAGPVYVFRNVIVGGPDPEGRGDLDGNPYFTAFAFKVGWDLQAYGRLYYYHNTVAFSGSTSDGSGIQNAGGAYFSGLVTRNNLWQVNDKVTNLRLPTTVTGHDLDCDNLHNPGTPTDTRFARWSNSGGPNGNGTYRNLADFQRYTGQELHGISNNGTLLNPDFSLRAGSPEIDAGCVITGFNDRGPSAYKDARPDIGAFEYANLPNLSTSSKTVSAGAVSTGDRITYTIRVVNTGSPLTSTAVMTDVLPAGLDYLAGTLTTTYGDALVKQGASTTSIQWQGLLSDTTVAEIRFGVRVNISDTSAVINTARIDSSLTKTINRSATIIVNGLPFYLPIILKGAQ